MQTLKNMIGMESSEASSDESTSTSTKPASETFVNGEVKRLQDELDEKDRRLKDLYQENELLKKDNKIHLLELDRQKNIKNFF